MHRSPNEVRILWLWKSLYQQWRQSAALLSTLPLERLVPPSGRSLDSSSGRDEDQGSVMRTRAVWWGPGQSDEDQGRVMRTRAAWWGPGQRDEDQGSVMKTTAVCPMALRHPAPLCLSPGRPWEVTYPLHMRRSTRSGWWPTCSWAACWASSRPPTVAQSIPRQRPGSFPETEAIKREREKENELN